MELGKLQVEYHDNRGTDAEPYGFLYFSDGRRMAYALGKLHPDATGGWEPLTPAHARAAEAYASSHGLVSGGWESLIPAIRRGLAGS